MSSYCLYISLLSYRIHCFTLFFLFLFFFFNDPATTEIYTLSLHDALPISSVPDDHQIVAAAERADEDAPEAEAAADRPESAADRKSTRLNSSHLVISYAVFCLKKKNKSSGRILVTHSARTAVDELIANI